MGVTLPPPPPLLSVTVGSILALVSNSEGGGNLFLKPGEVIVVHMGRHPETLVPRVVLMCHHVSSCGHNDGKCSTPPLAMVHGASLMAVDGA